MVPAARASNNGTGSGMSAYLSGPMATIGTSMMLTARRTASPISRMGTSVRTAGGSLAEDPAEELYVKPRKQRRPSSADAAGDHRDRLARHSFSSVAKDFP